MDLLKEEVYKHIQEYLGTIFLDIEKLFNRLEFDWRGDLSVVPEGNVSIVYWSGWNEQAINILYELNSEGRIKMKPISEMLYELEGDKLDLPIAKQNRKYKEQRWLPIAFYACK